ncbi:MAG: alpha/beta hydrolase [Solirubrobacterales bacterium]
MLGLPSPQTLGDAAANAFDRSFRGGVAEMEPSPSTIIEQAPKRTLRRYHPRPEGTSQTTPVLLVPPLAVPSQCFDLRRGCSLVEHLVDLGYPTYLVEYGAISYRDRGLGLEHWIENVLPEAAIAVTTDAGTDSVHLVGWSLGGQMSLLATADGTIPAASVTAIGSPMDISKVTLMMPLRQLSQLTGGIVGTGIYRVLGGAPAPIVKAAFQLSALDKHLTKPFVVALNLHDRDFLAQIEAVEHFTDNMVAYPGRTMGQLYHQFFRHNELSDGRLELGDRTINLADITAPVMAVAGDGDTLAPQDSVFHVADRLPNVSEVRLEVAPGGRLGILTSRSAEETTWRWMDEFMLAHDPESTTAADRANSAAAQ